MPKDVEGNVALRSLERKNIQLLIDSNKDIEILNGVYGAGVAGAKKKGRARA